MGTAHPELRRERIVSFVPSTTETIFELGASERLVGVTRFCVRPANAAEGRVVIGGTKAPRIDRILALEPDLVLANREENRKEDVEELRRSLEVFVAYPRGVDDAVSDIRKLSRLVGARENGEHLAEAIESARAKLRPRERFRYLYLIWQEPFMVAGADTFIDALLAEAGGVNRAPGGRGRYPTMTEEEIRDSGAEELLLATEPFPFDDGHAESLGARFPEQRLRVVDGQLLSWHGARLRAAFPYLVELAAALTT